jgi:hypothetical protein
LLQQAEFFVDSVSGYRSDFALFPEFFNAPLMAENNHLTESEAIRELAKHTSAIVDNFKICHFLQHQYHFGSMRNG